MLPARGLQLLARRLLSTRSAAAFDTLCIHADHGVDPTNVVDIAPPLSVSTTYVTGRSDFAYSRIEAPTRRRCEAVLSALDKGHSLLYSSGLSAIHAALIHLAPRRVLLPPAGRGYHGTGLVLDVLHRMRGIERVPDVAALGPGDVMWIETPLNPTSHVYNLEECAAAAHAQGAILVVDATFAPPPLQTCLDHGVDMVVHSATKYLGGHSDLLCGVVTTASTEVHQQLLNDRTATGAVPGNLETWLLLRSLRTVGLRVTRQARSAEAIVQRLDEAVKGGATSIVEVLHPLVSQRDDLPWIRRQMPQGLPPVFSLLLPDGRAAEELGSRLQYFQDGTSLGGVESLADHRVRWDPVMDPRLVRFSVGLEDPDDLCDDILRATRP